MRFAHYRAVAWHDNTEPAPATIAAAATHLPT
jgi:hypothetical protein